MERQTSLVNFRYFIEKFDLPISQSNKEWMNWLPSLPEYRDRYYGTALHFPLVLIESATGFSMEPSEFYGMRHLYTFFNWFLAIICFYQLLKARIKKRGLALCGVIMIILSPRFFAESFYNNKDVLFTAWYIISIFFSWRWLQGKSFINAMLTGIVVALTINTRFNGIVFLPLLVFFGLIDFFSDKRHDKHTLLSMILLLFTAFTFFYLITPNFWEHPIRTLGETFAFNQHHPNHGSDGNLFFGQLVDAAKTWYFIPVWIVLTSPLLYLLLSATGIVFMLKEGLRPKLRFLQSEAQRLDFFFFCIGFLPVTAIIAMHVTIYNSWRHCYFLYPSIIYFAAFGFSRLSSSVKNANGIKKSYFSLPIRVCLTLTFIYNAAWIAANHPYQYDYFSPFIRNKASLFSGDYWGISSRDLLRYIVRTDPERMIQVNHLYTQAGSINRGLLTPEERGYIDMTYDTENVDYFIACRDDKTLNDLSFPGYKKVFSIWVDRDEIGAVYKQTGSD